MDIQGVWIWLPGLPKSYYSNFLLRAISQAIGPVVKLDGKSEQGTVRTGSASNGLEGLRFSILEPDQIKGRDLGRTNFAKAGKSSQKEYFLGKKGMAKTHGKGIVIGSRPISSPNVLQPTNTNI
ncbi:hypothetical protein Gotur_011565, partial [Gossypium turneri]